MSGLNLGLSLPVDQPARLVLRHPHSGKPLVEAGADPETAEPAWIELYSLDSRIAREHERRVQQQLIEIRREGRRVGLTPEQIETNAVELLVALTKSWRLISLEGVVHADYACTPENRRALYADPGAVWIREDADRFLGSRANFGLPSSKS